MRQPAWVWIIIASIASLAIAILGFALHGDPRNDYGHDGFAEATRLTARHAFFWFIAAWTASSLARLWPGGWRAGLLMNRRGLGLGFAAAHLIHAGFFITLLLFYGGFVRQTTLYGGALGYVFVILMALTSNNISMRLLGPGWKALHTIGGVVIFAIFAFSYFGRLTTNPVLGVTMLSFCALALTLRIAAGIKARRAQAPL